MTPEFSRMVKVRPHPPERLAVEADAAERAALAARFGIEAVDRLAAELAFTPDGDAVTATGRLSAALIQLCPVAGDPFPVAIDEPVALRFVREGTVLAEDEEGELPADEPDEIEYAGDAFDVGEAIAQTLGLAIDPYAEGPNADAVRRESGIVQEGDVREGPLADLLRGLKPD